MQVIDIQETQTVDVVVKWNGYRKWLKNMTGTQATLNTTMIDPTEFGLDYCNGFIGVVPFTQLQSPDGSSIVVNVYVKCDNLQVNCLDYVMMARSRAIFAESGTCSLLTDVSSMSVNKSSATTQNICSDHFGEQILSFRSVLKRYVTDAASGTTLTYSPNSYWQMQSCIMPFVNPYYGAGDASNFTHFSYLRYAYLGYKGSIRWIFTFNAIYSGIVSTAQKTSLLTPSTTNLFYILSTGLCNAADYGIINGTTMDIPTLNAGIEVEFPFYSNNLFAFSFNRTTDDSLGQPSMEQEWFRNWQTRFNGINLPSSSGSAFHAECASGEDFTFLRFTGAPYYTAGVIA